MAVRLRQSCSFQLTGNGSFDQVAQTESDFRDFGRGDRVWDRIFVVGWEYCFTSQYRIQSRIGLDLEELLSLTYTFALHLSTHDGHGCKGAVSGVLTKVDVEERAHPLSIPNSFFHCTIVN
jgi:hypothetical protein